MKSGKPVFYGAMMIFCSTLGILYTPSENPRLVPAIFFVLAAVFLGGMIRGLVKNRKS